jgi:surfeit locus 1 family protein
MTSPEHRIRRRPGVVLKTVLFGIIAFTTAAACIRLGFWQLDRLEQRRRQNALIRLRGDSVTSLASIQGLDTAQSHWRRVRVRGTADYDAELVHATRSQNGSPGVHLLTPIRPLDGRWGDTAILVLRGFLASADGRTIDWKAARGEDTLSFDALVLSFSPRRPGAVRMPSAARAVRFVDRDSLSALMHRPLAPFMLLALGDTVVRDVTKPAAIPPPSLGEGPHQSYAFQWFAFATVAIVGFVAFVRAGSQKGPPRDV